MSRAPESSGDGVALAIAVLLAADALVVGLICGALISPWAGVGIGIAALAAPVLVGGTIIALINQVSGWSALARAFPSRPPLDEAQRGLAMSVSIRWAWLGYSLCVRWAADAERLHLSMVPILGMLSPAMSIPWADLDFDEASTADMIRCETTRGIRVWVPRQAIDAEASRRRAAIP